LADAQVNISKFNDWHKDLDLNELLSFINLNTYKLNKQLVAESAGFGYGALKPKNGNPQLIKVFEKFEEKIVKDLLASNLLIDKETSVSGVKGGVKKNSSAPVLVDDMNKTNKALLKRNAQLENEVFSLNKKIAALESQLKTASKEVGRHRETIQVINEVNGVL
jgi:hypothetical protein